MDLRFLSAIFSEELPVALKERGTEEVRPVLCVAIAIAFFCGQNERRLNVPSYKWAQFSFEN